MFPRLFDYASMQPPPADRARGCGVRSKPVFRRARKSPPALPVRIFLETRGRPAGLEARRRAQSRFGLIDWFRPDQGAAGKARGARRAETADASTDRASLGLTE